MSSSWNDGDAAAGDSSKGGNLHDGMLVDRPVADGQPRTDPTPSPSPPPPPPRLPPHVDFIAGTIAGITSLLCGQPFDTIKVRLQTQDHRVTAGTTRRYTSALQAATLIVKEEKMQGLFKGVMSPMLGIAAMNATVFGCYKLAMNSMLENPSATPTLWQVCLAGSASGIVTSLLTTPIERLKILQQATASAHQPSLRSLISSHSIRSLYRGWTPTILRDLAYGPYFMTYEAVCRWNTTPASTGYARDLMQEAEKEVRDVESGGVSRGRVLLAGGLAGIAGWGSTFALDVVKTRMQSTSITPAVAVQPATLQPAFAGSNHVSPTANVVHQTSVIPHPYRTTLSTITHSYQAEGWRVFVRGLGPTLARSVPVNAVCFLTFEWVVDLCRAAGMAA